MRKLLLYLNALSAVANLMLVFVEIHSNRFDLLPISGVCVLLGTIVCVWIWKSSSREKL